MLVRYVMCVAHDVCIMLRSSSMFLVSFCYVIMEEKVIIIVLSQHIVQGTQPLTLLLQIHATQPFSTHPTTQLSSSTQIPTTLGLTHINH